MWGVVSGPMFYVCVEHIAQCLSPCHVLLLSLLISLCGCTALGLVSLLCTLLSVLCFMLRAWCLDPDYCLVRFQFWHQAVMLHVFTLFPPSLLWSVPPVLGCLFWMPGGICQGRGTVTVSPRAESFVNLLVVFPLSVGSCLLMYHQSVFFFVRDFKFIILFSPLPGVLISIFVLCQIKPTLLPSCVWVLLY